MYPHIEPYNSGFLKVSDIHTLYYEESGNPNGLPIVYLHGGPGGNHLDPNAGDNDGQEELQKTIDGILILSLTELLYLINEELVKVHRNSSHCTYYIDMDYRSACLQENDTWKLVQDIESIRQHLKIEKWIVFGGSWGSTLALTYAISHANRVNGLILRGIFTLRKCEVDWFYQQGASYLFPDVWDEYVKPIPEQERNDFISAYYKRLTGSDTKVQLECAKAWSKWECATSKLLIDPEMLAKVDNDTWALQFARIECHYFINNGFFDSDSYILDNVDKIKHIPAVIVQGRYDVVCPMKTAWELHKKWGCELKVLGDCGHSAKEVGIRQELVNCCNAFRDRFLSTL